jgi:hypothetical protein
VYDLWKESQSEEAIQQSIIPFNVEVLDWRRTDLSIRTIRTAASNVRVLHLFCSGGWAALSDWTGSNLASLPKVRFASDIQ